MGGYGGSKGRIKERFYRDSGGKKVRDPNAIAIAEYYIDQGEYVVFLQEKEGQKRADLSVGGVHVEVKAMSSLSTNKVANNLKEAFEQVEADNYRYPEDTHRSGRVVILSKYPNAQTAYRVVFGGFRKAKRLGYVKGDVYLLHGNKLYFIGGM